MIDAFRLAIRQHRHQRGFAATVICTLALAIGAAAAVFALVSSVLVRALPYPSPERLVWVASVRSDNPSAPFTLPEFMDYRSRTRTLAGLAAYANWSASLAGDGLTERLTGARMSANAFEVLGVSPAAGRLLNDTDDRADAPLVAVISYRLWQRLYGGADDVVGKAVRINSESFVIVGVLPAQFPLPMRDIDIVTPLAPDRDPLRHVRNSVNFLRFFGRLSIGTGHAQAQAELTAIAGSLRQQFPVEYARKQSVRVDPLHDMLVGDVRQSMLVLLAAVIVVLATALANLVSLALVRANARRAELSLRVAIGASRLHLVRQLTVEALVLAAIGSGVAWAIAAQAIALALLWAPASIPRLDEVRLGGVVALFVLGITALVTLLLAAIPLAAVARTRASDALQMASRGAIGDRWNHRVRNVMVVAEISAALVLVLATLALVQNLRQLQELHPGFNPEGVLQARVAIPPAYRTPEDIARFYERLSDRISASPGVKQFGVISIAPLSGLLRTVPFSVAGQPVDPRERASANLREISPGYLETVGTRLLQGRALVETDGANAPRVALVSAALVERFLPGRVLGQQLLINDNNSGPRPVEIVGVVESVRQTALDLPPALDIYIPLRQIHADSAGALRHNQFWMVKTDSDPGSFGTTFVAHLRAIDPDAAVSGIGSMQQFVDAWFGPRRFNLGLFAAFAVTAIVLAVSGLYGLVSYTVSQRAPEIGLRMAIGATQGEVQRMILRQAARLGVAGTAAGIGVALAARPLVARMAPDVSIHPAIVAATAALLMAVVLIAAGLPARRAARIAPTLALKAQ